LVVAEANVEPGAVPLDHGLLEDERLLLGGSRDHLELVDAGDHGGDVLGQHAGCLEVVRHAVAQAERLAGVNHPAERVAHQVDASRFRQRLEALAEVFGPLRDWRCLLTCRRHGTQAIASSRPSTRLRYWPVSERRFRTISSGVPAATTSPPLSPPSGPRSMMWSAVLRTSRLCSMTTTVFPASTRRCRTLSRRSMSAKCRPVVGSSRI